jgi:hypothetical protein
MSKLTTAQKRQLEEMTTELRPHVDTLLMAMALSQLERERVDKIQRAVLAEEVYLMAEEHLHRGREDRRITDPKNAWLMCDDDAARYYPKLNAIHLANGYADAAKGFCPALVAEHDTIRAEWALIEAAQKWYPEIDNDRLLCGTGKGDGLETRRKYIDLLIGMVVNKPGYTSPLKRSA